MIKQSMLGITLGGFCAFAPAQSNVSIYGVMDINVTTISGGSANGFTGVEPGGISGSRLGFKGSEDLGNGTKAIFTMEFGSIKNDRNAGLTGSRQSFVGLQGSWGTLIGGYVYSPADDFNVDFSGFSNSALLEPRSNMLNDGGFSTKVDDTLENGLSYISPKVGPVTLRGAFSLGEQTSGPKEHKFALAAEYADGPMRSTLLHHHVSNVGAVNPKEDLNETALGLRYDFDAVQLMGTIVTKKQDNAGRDNVLSLGARIPVGAGTVRFSYARLDQSKKNGDKDASGWAAGYYYGLSKRTTLYGGMHFLDNSSRASYNHERLTGLSTGDNARLFTVGMRHKF